MRKRKNIRLKGFKYTNPGGYFVTISTHKGMGPSILGEIKEGGLKLSKYGRIVNTNLAQIADHFENVVLDTYVIMPNHIHAIVFITENTPGKSSNTLKQGSLGAIIGSFKSSVTKAVNKSGKIKGNSFWQRNYFERIIRNEKELDNIRKYIQNNVNKWIFDRENPSGIAEAVKPYE